MLQYWLGNLMSLLSSTNFSFKITILKNIFQEYEQSVKQYGSRCPTFFPDLGSGSSQSSSEKEL